jgi:hypothetical protein
MEVRFRECDWFDLWIWIKFSETPSQQEKQLLDDGFNACNMQVLESGVDISYFDYDNQSADDEMMSVMHNMTDLEYENEWARCWVDLGTTDAIAIDTLVNALRQFDKEYVAIEEVVVGGQNSDWLVEAKSLDDEDYDR